MPSAIDISKLDIKSIKTSSFLNSVPHIIMLILKSFGINKFATVQELAFVTPHASRKDLSTILQPLVDYGYLSTNDNTFALTYQGNALLYEVVGLKRPKKDKDPDF